MIKLLLQLTWFARHYVCHLHMVRLCSCVSRDRGTKCHLVEACVAPYLIVSGRFIKNAIIPARSSTQRSRATSLWVTDFRVSWAWNRRCRIDFCVWSSRKKRRNKSCQTSWPQSVTESAVRFKAWTYSMVVVVVLLVSRITAKFFISFLSFLLTHICLKLHCSTSTLNGNKLFVLPSGRQVLLPPVTICKYWNGSFAEEISRVSPPIRRRRFGQSWSGQTGSSPQVGQPARQVAKEKQKSEPPDQLHGGNGVERRLNCECKSTSPRNMQLLLFCCIGLNWIADVAVFFLTPSRFPLKQ